MQTTMSRKFLPLTQDHKIQSSDINPQRPQAAHQAAIQLASTPFAVYKMVFVINLSAVCPRVCMCACVSVHAQVCRGHGGHVEVKV